MTRLEQALHDTIKATAALTAAIRYPDPESAWQTIISTNIPSNSATIHYDINLAPAPSREEQP